MNAVGSLLLLIAVAIIAAMGGFVASAVVLRKRRRARGYFILGVVTGWTTAVIAHRDLRAFAAVLARSAALPLTSRRKTHAYDAAPGHFASARANITGLVVSAAHFRGSQFRG